MDIGSEIRKAREAKGWSQAQLAVAAGVGIVTVGQIERGAVARTATLQKLFRVLGLELRLVRQRGAA